MKHKISVVVAVLVALILASCEKESDFDRSLLTGKWQSGTLYYRYFSNGTGYTWDEGDDVREDEAQHFTWTLIESELIQIHIMEMGEAPIRREYTVTELSSTRLRYRDGFGRSYSFTKVD